MSFMKKKKQIRFEAAKLTESAAYLLNPSCGWYRIYPFAIEEKQDFEELYWCLCAEERIVLALVDIGAFRDDALPEDALDNLKQILEFFQKHGKEIILRITYDREGRGMEREPDFLNTVLGHMRQLGAVVSEYKDSVLVVQGVLVGSWGEMHDSKFLSMERLRKLTHAWQECLGDIPMAVRTPQQWRMLHNDGVMPGKDKIGLFNDGMFGSADDLGTYGWQTREDAGWQGQWCREEEIAFIGRTGKIVPYGGEAVGQVMEFSPAKLVEEMRRTGVCYLNSTHDARCLQRWKESLWEETGVWNQKSTFDYIGCHLGSRFVVRKAEFTGKKDLSLKIYIENTGFSTLKEPAELVLGMGEDYILPDSLCGLPPQEIKEITVKLPQEITEKRMQEIKGMQEYTVSLSMRRKRDKCPLLFANEPLRDGSVTLGVLRLQN